MITIHSLRGVLSDRFVAGWYAEVRVSPVFLFFPGIWGFKRDDFEQISGAECIDEVHDTGGFSGFYN